MIAEDNELAECWCGAVGTIDELFAWGELETRCGGSGVLHCFCGGDFCVCHFHGEEQCDGCEDCEMQDHDYDYWEDEEPC